MQKETIDILHKLCELLDKEISETYGDVYSLDDILDADQYTHGLNRAKYMIKFILDVENQKEIE